MRYIIVKAFNEESATVLAIYHNRKPEIEGLIETNAEIPEQATLPNMDAYLRINLATKEFYYDYIQRETFESQMTLLQQENSELKQAVAELSLVLASVMGGGE